jgi:hypothetical protein
MGLIDLKTNLKSLRYGNDQLGGGNSGQPYIQTPIPEGFNNLLLSSNDFILRGGALTAKNSALDISRLTKMFNDPKSINGQFFIAKQNLLSRTAVRTQASGILNEGIYTPLSTLAEAGLVGFGGHVNKQGLNPFAGVGSGGYYDGTYLQALANQTINIGESTENRLVQLFGFKIIDFQSPQRNLKNTNNINTLSNNTLITYDGGPGSILGVGKTNINIARTNNGGLLQTIYNPNKFNPKLGTANFITTGVSGFRVDNSKNAKVADGVIVKAKSYSFNNERNSPAYIPFIGKDFRQELLQILDPNTLGENATSSLLSKSPDYSGPSTYESRVNIGGTNKLGPGNRQGKNLISYSKGSGIGPIDKINALPIYKKNGVTQNQVKNDLVKFRIAVINNQDPTSKTFMHFRAFIDGFTDSYNANWSPIKYLGRGENFYTYSDFTRAISLDWTVVAQSKQELIPMYKKLNYLASSLTPDYTPKGYMAGNLVQLTVGGYLYEQVGFFTSLTYNMSESTYEIGIDDTTEEDGTVKELPHMVKVTAAFTPIHDFIPSLQSIGSPNTDADEIDGNEYGSQRYIALANGYGDSNSNYNYIDTTNLALK